MRRSVWTVAAILLSAGCGGGDGGGVTTPPGGGTLQGEVTGPGGPVPGAQVSLSGGGNAETDDEGRFSFTNLEPGAKTVTVTPPAAFVLATGETAAKSATVPDGGSVSVAWSVRLSDGTPRSQEIGLSASTFSPRDVILPVGSSVTWVNQTSITHTISPNDPAQTGAWTDETIGGQGTEFDHTFATAGTFDYVCKLHSGMNGVVRVH
jgi:plastocyanin